MYLVNIPQKEKAVLFGTNCMSRLCVTSRIDVWYFGDNMLLNIFQKLPVVIEMRKYARSYYAVSGRLYNRSKTIIFEKRESV